jgi:hypothetical protein
MLGRDGLSINQVENSHFRLFDRTALVVGGGVYRHWGAGVLVVEGDAIGYICRRPISLDV